MILTEISWIAVLIGVILNMALGAFWYSPSFLGLQWLESYGFKVEEMRHSPLHYLGAVLIALIMTLVVAGFVRAFEINHLWISILVAFWIWLGFIVTTQFSGVIWSRKPLKAFLIDIAYYLVTLQMLFILFTFIG